MVFGLFFGVVHLKLKPDLLFVAGQAFNLSLFNYYYMSFLIISSRVSLLTTTLDLPSLINTTAGLGILL